jgi:phytoene synthase
MPAAPDLPRPFSQQWSRRRRPAARALWRWHAVLADPSPPADVNGDLSSFFAGEQARAEAGEPLRLVPDAVSTAAFDACAEHDLDRSLLALQVSAAEPLCGRTRFPTEDDRRGFVERWAVPHGRLLAGLAGVAMSVQLQYVDELARGFFYLNRLARLPHDLSDDRLFLPVEALRQKGVSLDQLAAGDVDESVRALLWKESVRVRDALAQGRSLIAALSFRHRFALKRFWIGALELLNELERRDYDLWSRPLTLSFVRRAQVYLQTLLGRSLS